MRKLLLAALVLTGCGGSLNPELAGEWTGTMTLSSPGLPAISAGGYLKVTVDGGKATISQICFDGAGEVEAEGDGDTADWSGEYECPPVNFAGCSTMVVKFRSMTVALRDGGRLLAEGGGSMSGCGDSFQITMTFSGEK
jgi:hypothetical protein